MLFALLGFWTVDAFGQVQRVVGFRRRHGRGAGWATAVETTDLAGMLAIGEIRSVALAILCGRAETDIDWSEFAAPQLAFRLREQGLVICLHLSDAVCIARARRYWRYPFEMAGAGPLWNRADRQARRLRRLIMVRCAARAWLPTDVADLLRQYLEAAKTEPRHQPETYLSLARRMHDERDAVGRAAWRFLKQHDLEVYRIAGRLWDRFEDRFLGMRERRLERWCAAQPGVTYCRPTG